VLLTKGEFKIMSKFGIFFFLGEVEYILIKLLHWLKEDVRYRSDSQSLIYILTCRSSQTFSNTYFTTYISGSVSPLFATSSAMLRREEEFNLRQLVSLYKLYHHVRWTEHTTAILSEIPFQFPCLLSRVKNVIDIRYLKGFLLAKPEETWIF